LSSGVEHMALIVHNNCMMTNPLVQQEEMRQILLQKYGWTNNQAESTFNQLNKSQIGDPISFALSESSRLQNMFKGLTVVPLLYDIYSDRLYIVKEMSVLNIHANVRA
jgi:hypothetical protein